MDYERATPLFNKEVLERPASAYLHLVTNNWMQDFCEAFAKRHNTQRAVAPILDEFKALWRELAASAADKQWVAGTLAQPELLLEQDAGAMCGAYLPIMPETLGAPLPGLEAHDTSRLTGDDVLDAAYENVCRGFSAAILDDIANLPKAAVMKALHKWLRDNVHAQLVSRVNKNNVSQRLQRRQKHQRVDT